MSKRIEARMRRRSYWDDAYAERVWQRYERRRQLPARQLHMAWLELCDTIAGPPLRWIAARVKGGRHGNG